MNYQRLVILSVFFLSLFQFSNGLAAPLNSGSCRIVKVSRLDAEEYELGRKNVALLYQFNYIDKFYTKKRLPETEVGEFHFIEWRCSNVSRAGEKIQLQFEYRTVNHPAVQKKNIDIFVDRKGFYETPVEHRGESFLNEGRIESWKVTILKEGKVLDYQRSAFWTEP